MNIMSKTKSYWDMNYFKFLCIQISKKADVEINLTPITADISLGKGRVVIFKDGLIDKSKMLLPSRLLKN